MWAPRLVESARMIYLGIVEALEADIRSGLVLGGEMLPPQRAIAQALGVNLTTVTRAFNEARRRGLVEAQAGRGTFISGRPDGTEPGESAHPLLDLGMNIPPQPPEADFRKMFSQGIGGVLGGPRGLLSLQYQESTGTLPDRHMAAGWLSRRIEGAGADRIVVTGGAQAALFALCDLLLDRGDVVAAGAMTYPGFKAVAAQKGLILVPLAMDAEGIVPDAFAKACREKSPKALYLIPTIDNPTTATMSESRRRAIASLARRHGVTIIEDDPYAPLRTDRVTAVAELAADITWHIATLSKCATPALRIAYVLAPNAAKALQLAGVLRATTLMAAPLMSALASRWIADGSLDEIAVAIRKENAARQKLAAAIFGSLDYAAGAQGPHLWLRLPSHWLAADFTAQAGLAGVAIVPASAFALTSQAVEAVRLSLGAAPDREALEEGLTQLAALIASHPSPVARAVV